ncbi:MAG: phage-related minor tail protein [Paracoccaceae bacterium]|jgi:phage-related minor tail protein
MMADLDAVSDLEDQIDALETSLAGAGAMVGAFDGELQRMQSSLTVTQQGVGQLSSSISRGLRGAFDGLVFDGMKLSDALKGVAGTIVNATYAAALKPVTNQFGSALAGGIESFIGGAMPFAKGGSFAQGRVMPFAKGGVVTGPTQFPMRGGVGLMGEAGPEAIMPLTRGADGRLGVRSNGAGARPVQITMNISTPDAQSFQRSQGQIAAQMSRVLGRGQRNR